MKSPARATNQRAELKALARPAKVGVLAIGGLPQGLVAAAAQELARVYELQVVTLAAQGRPDFARNDTRAQFHSAAILRRLAHLDAGMPVVGITDVDLFVPDAPFVFGEADRDAGVAVVSIARLRHGPEGKDVDPDRLRKRALVEIVHELGHLLGLSHCTDHRCAMFLSHRPSDADRKGPGLCGACRAALGLP